MPWRVRGERRRQIVQLILLGVFAVLVLVVLAVVYATPPCSLEAPMLLHQLTGCQVVLKTPAAARAD